jgi:hypothetical protein
MRIIFKKKFHFLIAIKYIFKILVTKLYQINKLIVQICIHLTTLVQRMKNLLIYLYNRATFNKSYKVIES